MAYHPRTADTQDENTAHRAYAEENLTLRGCGGECAAGHDVRAYPRGSV